MTRAKMVLESKTPNPDDPTIVDVKFRAVYGDGSDNASWSKWTPSGVIELQITNPAAHEPLEVGAEFYVDFSRVPPHAPVESTEPTPAE